MYVPAFTCAYVCVCVRACVCTCVGVLMCVKYIDVFVSVLSILYHVFLCVVSIYSHVCMCFGLLVGSLFLSSLGQIMHAFWVSTSSVFYVQLSHASPQGSLHHQDFSPQHQSPRRCGPRLHSSQLEPGTDYLKGDSLSGY